MGISGSRTGASEFGRGSIRTEDVAESPGDSQSSKGPVRTAPKTRTATAPGGSDTHRIPPKLTPARTPYLTQIAIDIHKDLIDRALKNPAGTVRLYKKAVEKARKKEDTSRLAKAHTDLGHVYYVTGQLKHAAENYDNALEVVGAETDSVDAAVAHRNLGAALTAFGDYQRAERHLATAVTTLTVKGDLKGTQMALNNVGVLEKNQGHFEKARTAYEKALATNVPASREQVMTHNNLAELCRSRGESKKAIELFAKSLSLASSTGDRAEEGRALLNIAGVHRDQGQYDKALERAQKAFEVFRQLKAPVDQAQKLMGDVYLDMGKIAQAEPHLKQAGYGSSLGRMYLMKSEPSNARKHYEQILSAGQKQNNLQEIATACTGLGTSFEASKDYKQAASFYSKGVDATEQVRSSLLLSERTNFFAASVDGFCHADPAKGLVRVSLKQDKGILSIRPSEATKAREFADNLSHRAEGQYFGVPEAVLKKEVEVNNKLASLRVSVDLIPKGLDNERHKDLTNQIKTAESERQALVDLLRKEHKDYACVKYPEPVQLEDAALAADEHAILLDVLGEGVGVRLVKGKELLDSYFVEWNPNDLEETVRKFRKPFEEVELSDFDTDLAGAITKKLLSHALKKVSPGTNLIIIPDGVLALIPFEALVVDGSPKWHSGQYGDYPEGLTYLGDVHPIIYYQSLTALTLARTLGEKTKVGDRMLVMADPVFEIVDARAREKRPETKAVQQEKERFVSLMAAIEEDSGGYFKFQRLPETGELAKQLDKLFSGSCDVYTGFESTKTRFLTSIVPQMSRYRSLVLATHGFAGNSIPGIMEPVLVLTMVPPGTDGFLTMSEVAGLNMNIDIACLTACQTGVGIKLAGEGVMSMGRAFQCAGARSVAMSLWSVAETSSVILMEEFLKYVKNGKPKLEAWVAARKDLRKAGFEHPFFWGAFILAGEAR